MIIQLIELANWYGILADNTTEATTTTVAPQEAPPHSTGNNTQSTGTSNGTKSNDLGGKKVQGGLRNGGTNQMVDSYLYSIGLTLAVVYKFIN